VDKPKVQIKFVDYHWDLMENGDIRFDPELTMESMRFYEGKTFKVTTRDGCAYLKFVEDWDMMPDPDEIDWHKHFAEGGVVQVDWDEKRMDIIGQNGNDGLHYENKENNKNKPSS
tara:strand:+ start:150 stop:494 length:345 start_codon:yes stop_codon:yes gene_type:complete